jgi:hypothetical protein
MNNKNRKELQTAIRLIEDAKQIVERIKDDEQDKFDNLSEVLQQSENGQKLEENVSTLEDAISQIEEVIDFINTASE